MARLVTDYLEAAAKNIQTPPSFSTNILYLLFVNCKIVQSELLRV